MINGGVLLTKGLIIGMLLMFIAGDRSPSLKLRRASPLVLEMKGLALRSSKSGGGRKVRTPGTVQVQGRVPPAR